MNNLNSPTPKWWQQPQPAWVTILVSTLLLSLLFGLWQLSQASLAFGDEDTTTASTPQTGGVIPYQGFLTDANGQPLNDNVNIQVELFNASSGGTSLLPSELHSNVPVTDGLFNVAIGSQTTGSIPNTVWDSASVYAQITVSGETLSPRDILYPPLTQLPKVAYAQKSANGWTPEDPADAFVEELDMSLMVEEESLVFLSLSGTFDCSADCYIQIYRDSTKVYEGSYAVGFNGERVPMSAQYLDIANAGSYVYRVYLSTSNNGSTQRIYRPNFTAIAFPSK